jgi:1-deoxy-D-xylulose-5-phosphate reductoisomerase
MKLPIQYALSYPERWSNGSLNLDPLRMGSLDFSAPDMDRFPCLRLAYEAARSGGSAPCVLNAANEVAVASFLAGRMSFGRIADVIEATLAAPGCPNRIGSLEGIFAADAFARRVAQGNVRKYVK